MLLPLMICRHAGTLMFRYAFSLPVLHADTYAITLCRHFSLIRHASLIRRAIDILML